MSRVITIDYPEALTMAVEVLQAGGLVVLPTDTVYGVGCLLKAPAIDRVFSAKRRTPEKAIPVLLASIDNVHQVVSDFSEPARRLAEAFWPGPLTVIIPASAKVPLKVTGNTGRLAVRQSRSKVGWPSTSRSTMPCTWVQSGSNQPRP